jgi:AcrR family transcriptional regulator
MHDICAEAGISVGLIYRYFENKDAVISAMADEHKRKIQDVLARARLAPSLVEAMEILFNGECCEDEPVEPVFVVDLFAEAGRNPRVATLVRSVAKMLLKAVTDLIEHSPEGAHGVNGMTPRQVAELFFDLHHGVLMREVIETARNSHAERRAAHTAMVRQISQLLFRAQISPSTRLTASSRRNAK